MHIGLSGWQRESTRGDHRAFLRLFERADALGFDSVWFNEFHFHRTEIPYPSPLLLAVAVFARTERLRVGTSVLLPALHHPLLLAEQIAQVDYQSGGRLDVGLGRGSANPEQYVALGLDPDSMRSRFVEAYDVLLGALAQSAVSAGGEHWRFDDVAVGPAPVQQPHPPIYIAGYTRESIAFAVDRRVPLLMSLEPPEERQLAHYRAIIAERGLPYDISGFSYTRHVCLGRTPAEADTLVGDLLPRLHQRRLFFAARRGQPASEIQPRSKEDFLREQAIAGDPQACLDQLAALARSGITHLRLVFNGNGELSNDQALGAMQLFAREVLPGCRAL
jgi:alkanesulfonate monooxygenase SsuD/methylene tetrahydromethanopterin reductase-like flavin-dependent oxidoreductase (luciferase family)